MWWSWLSGPACWWARSPSACVSKRIPATGLIGAGICLVGLMLGVSGLLPASGFWVFVVFCVVMGIAVPLFAAPITAIFQTLIDPAKLGRVLALYATIALLAAVPGLLLAGPLAERTGIAVWFAISGGAVLVTGLLPWVIPAVRRLDPAMARAQSDTVRDLAHLRVYGR